MFRASQEISPVLSSEDRQGGQSSKWLQQREEEGARDRHGMGLKKASPKGAKGTAGEDANAIEETPNPQPLT